MNLHPKVKWAAGALLPPIIFQILVKLRPKPKELFDGQGAEDFVAILDKAKLYGEYGVGASTLWVAQNTNAQIISVETDSKYADYVRRRIDPDRGQIIYVNLGIVGDWGRPVDYSEFDRFGEYFEGIWKKGVKPDVVLIDGRFRVACFLSSLLLCEDGATIIFDDYKNRKYYHVIERVILPTKISGRQAIFKICLEELDKQLILELRQAFLGCMD